MNKIRTNREFIFNLYLYFNPGVIENLIGYNLEDLRLESNFYGRKIDIFGKSDQREVYIETQITKSDETHLKQIKYIIDNVCPSDRKVIVWIANSFHKEMLDSVEEYIQDAGKDIEFMAIDLVSGVDMILETLEFFGEFGITENLWRLNNIIKLEVVSKYFRKTTTNIISENSIQKEIKTEKEIVMEKVLKEIRRQLFYFVTVYREKRLDGNLIVLGSGFSEINFFISLNRFNDLTVEIRFNQNTKDIFNKFLEDKDDFEEVMDYTIDWDCKDVYRIYSEQAYKGNKERVIKQQVRVLEKLINYFTTFMDSMEMMEEIS